MNRNDVAFGFATTVRDRQGTARHRLADTSRGSVRWITGKLLLVAVLAAIVASLSACSSSGTSGLTSKKWQLTAITEKVPAFQGVIPAADQPKYQVVFHDDGKVSGAADCNQFGGTYKTTGSDGLAIAITTA